MTSEIQAIRVARIVARTDAEGPGTRFAVWVQGCSIRCEGCFNPHLWIPSGAAACAPRLLAEQAITAQVSGVTILGGEPFDQAEALAVFAGEVRRAGLSVMTFTGHTLTHLEAQMRLGKTSVRALLKQTDLLVDGPYLAGFPDQRRPWVGSTNQQFHFLTSRYAHLKRHLSGMPDRLEVRVDAYGTTAINGWANLEALDKLLSDFDVST